MGEPSRRILSVLLLLLAMSGCELVRKVTYPPSFTYLEQGDVRTSMARMADSIRRIDSILTSSIVVTEQQRELIIEELNLLDRTAVSLGAGTQVTNHLLLDEHVDEFRSLVMRATDAVFATPPSYYWTGQLTGACLSCHVLR